MEDFSQCLGECVYCREEFEAAGEPDRVTLVPRGSSGGICVGCGKTTCNEHGKRDEEGRFWCESCAFDEKLRQAQEGVMRVLFGKKERNKEAAGE